MPREPFPSAGGESAGPWRSPERGRPSRDGPPLAGIRVLDLATALAAPLAAGILAEQGADVIKIEPPGGGDVLRHAGPAVVLEAEDRNMDAVILSVPYKRRFGSCSMGATASYVFDNAPCRVILWREPTPVIAAS